jgi:uncharacterized coiled-coil protein SlyX
MTDERLTDLELRFMKLERFTHELSAVVAAQQKVIDALATEAKRLRERANDEGSTVPNDTPPHY